MEKPEAPGVAVFRDLAAHGLLEGMEACPIHTPISESSGPQGFCPPTQVRNSRQRAFPAPLHVFPVLLNSQSLLPHLHPQIQRKEAHALGCRPSGKMAHSILAPSALLSPSAVTRSLPGVFQAPSRSRSSPWTLSPTSLLPAFQPTVPRALPCLFCDHSAGRSDDPSIPQQKTWTAQSHPGRAL